MSNPKDAFQELVRIFSSRDNQVLEIEIIPSSLGATFLQDGCSLGLTKKSLVQAFTVARQLFFDQLLPMSEDDLQNTFSANAQSRNADSAITEMMLLFDCEHLTACNWRKRRLQAAMAHYPGIPNQTSTATKLLEAELTLMSSYQCSPLHRHTKSPTLWHHRLWVVVHLLQRRHWSPEDLLMLQRTELGVVLRAGELHPKNYYAFNYMRQLDVLLAATVEKTSGQSTRETRSAQSVVERVIDWCLANPRDISGWSFGLYVLRNTSEQHIRRNALEKVVRFALNVGWEGESLWTFVDQASRHFGLESVIEHTMLFHCDQATRTRAPQMVQDSQQNQSWQTWLARARVYWVVDGQGQDT
ncbi:Protein prenyltransferase [Penicillium concentricum]|uniref:Protein prenyltransferase n=1 Tax=Penicillium concentricum TaxID=293559 RepID=A0A9W9S7R8_9EURO|nr:Protein prenyltransferase [Penicillium concentricum]KAJ5373503.1 Protein prenyltransferase [Penicillium concentricum]